MKRGEQTPISIDRKLKEALVDRIIESGMQNQFQKWDDVFEYIIENWK